jgi:TerC family integral membrane protein
MPRVISSVSTPRVLLSRSIPPHRAFRTQHLALSHMRSYNHISLASIIRTSDANRPRATVSCKAKSKAEQELDSQENLTVQEAKVETLALYVGLAAAFGAGIWAIEGPVKAQEYFAGYLLEQSLSIDNLFVFVLVFSYFKTPPDGQAKVLTYGIWTAVVLRAILVLVGVQLIEMFEPVLALFAGILLFSSYKLLSANDEDEEEDLSDNAIVKFCKSSIKSVDQYDGNNFFSVLADGTKAATPLLLTLAVIELSDVVFAVDSIPAVFGVTLDPFIVYTSNMFAILSLRALYGFVSTVMSELKYLDKAVALVLGFIGSKMLLAFADIEISTDVSLLVVAALLGGGVAASLLLPDEEAEKNKM